MESFTVSESPLAELIRGRRTINLFQPEPPPLATLLQAIELARWAPNHKHTEPWTFHLIGPQTAEKIVDLNAQLVAQAKGSPAGWPLRASAVTIRCRPRKITPPAAAQSRISPCTCGTRGSA